RRPPTGRSPLGPPLRALPHFVDVPSSASGPSRLPNAMSAAPRIGATSSRRWAPSSGGSGLPSGEAEPSITSPTAATVTTSPWASAHTSSHDENTSYLYHGGTAATRRARSTLAASAKRATSARTSPASSGANRRTTSAASASSLSS